MAEISFNFLRIEVCVVINILFKRWIATKLLTVVIKAVQKHQTVWRGYFLNHRIYTNFSSSSPSQTSLKTTKKIICLITLEIKKRRRSTRRGQRNSIEWARGMLETMRGMSKNMPNLIQWMKFMQSSLIKKGYFGRNSNSLLSFINSARGLWNTFSSLWECYNKKRSWVDITISSIYIQVIPLNWNMGTSLYSSKGI